MATARLKDKLKQTARTTTQAARAAADRSAQKAGAKKQEKPAKSTPVRNVKNRTKGMTQKAQAAAKEQNRTPRRKPSVQAAGKQAAQKVKGSQKVKDYQKMNQAGLQSLERSRFAQDMAARQAVRQDNIGRGTNLPQKSTGILKGLGMEKYREPGRKENNPNTPAGMYKTTLPESDLDRITKDADLRQKNYGLDGEKVPTRDIIDSANLDPLSALKADSMSHANFGRGKGAKIAQKEKTDKELVQEAVDRLTAHTRQRGARQQTLSRHDNKLRAQMRDEIKLAKQDYDTAKRKGDAEGMAKAHQRAETIRRQEGGYSGGATGAGYETPEISREDRATLNKEGLTRLAAAKLGYDNAKTDEERELYRKQGADIRKSARYQREEYDRGAYRETDANGRMRYVGTAEERQKEQEQAAAIPQAILTGLGGSFASLPEGTLRALQADAARNQERLQALSDIRGGGEVNVSEPGAIDPDSLGQRLLRQSQEYREKATDGQKGLERYLTEALITGGEMAPGLIATALTGGAAAPGLAVMGAQAAGQRMGNLNAQGVDPVQAFNRGILSGAIEAGSELIPLRNLAKIARGGGDTFARNLATQALEEVGTEEASEIGNYLADRAFGDPNASLTARDLMDTAAISALTSIGMGAGAGMIGTRRTGQRTEQDAKTITAMDQVTPTVDDLAQQEAALQEQVDTWKMQARRILDRLQTSAQDPTWHKHLLGELAQHRAQFEPLRQQLIGLEMQKAQRTQVEQEKAQQAQRQAEEAQRAEQERLEAQEAVLSTEPAGETPQEAAQQPQTNPVPEQATEPIQEEALAEGQETPRATSQQYDQPENHIDNRTSETLGDRRTKAFQWDHPEVKPFYQDAARALRQDVEASMASARNVRASQHNQSLGKQAGTIMDRNEPLRQLHEMGLSSTEILKGLDAIIRDDGAENIASAKRVELALDDMLSNGYIPVEAGGNPDAFVGPNQDYIQAKSRITGGTAQGSFEEYLRNNALALELGEVTEDELRAEWEAGQNQESEEFKKWFDGSRVVQADGSPKLMYHGTSKYGFDRFDPYSSSFGLFGYGSYFTDDPTVAESYTKKGKGQKPGVYSAYLSIRNPIDMDAPANMEEWIGAFRENEDLDVSYLLELKGQPTNEDCFRALKENLADLGYYKFQGEEAASDFLQFNLGYDGITHIGGGRFNKKDNTRHRVYIAFNDDQIQIVSGRSLATGQRLKNTPPEAEESTAVNTNPAQHTPEEQAVIEAYQNSTDDVLKEVFESHLQNPRQTFTRQNISSVTERQAADANRLLGGDYSGYQNAINTNGINHILRRHGPKGTADHSLGDLNDAARIAFVLENYDDVTIAKNEDGTDDVSIEFMDRNNNPARKLVYRKKVNGTYYVVEAAPETKYRKLWVISAYMTKAEGITQALDARNPEITSETALASQPSAVGNSIYQSEPESNGNFAETTESSFQSAEEEAASLRERYDDLQRRYREARTEEEREAINREKEQWDEDVRGAQERWSVGAAPGGFDPFSRLANEYGTIEPGENPARMVDVPVSTNGEDRVRRYARTAMEAEVTPDEAMAAFEQDVVNGLFSYHPRRDADAVAAARNTIESKGYDGALQQWNDVVEGRRIAGKDDVVLAQMLYSLAAQNGDINTVRRLAAEIAAEGTVSGQKIQALRLLKKATPEGKLYYIRKTVGKLQDDLNRSRGDKAPTLEIDPELEEALLDAGTQEEQQDVLDRIYDDVAKQIPATLGDRLNAWRYFAMLGNPRTHIRNVVGNIVVQAPLQVSNKASALAQAALPKEQRTRAVIASREAKRFARDDYQYMKDVLSGDKYISEESEIKRRQTLFPAPIQKAMNFNSKALEAEDMVFKKGTYIQSLASFITARGWDPQTMTAGQLEQARTHAIKDARHATFQDESALASAIAKLERKNKATKVAIGGLVPFKGVPINIAKMGFDLSPAGLAKAITYDAAQVKKGNMDATDMIDHLTRGLTGTSVAALGYFLAAQGWLTAGADDDDKENYFNMAQGSQEYALDLGDWSYTIDWAAPSAIPLFLGAEYFNARQKWGEESDDESKAFKDGLESLSRLFDPMLNMTVLSGVSDTLNTISYSQTNPIFPLAWGIGQNYLGQFVPTLSGQIARTVDDTRRTTFVDRESPVPNSIQRFIQRQENKIPGLSQRNLPYLDSWGREDRTESPLLRAFENFISPGYVSKRNTDAVDEELQRLHDLDYDGVLPSKAQTNTKINDRYLSKDEYEKLVRTQGSQARNMLAEVIGTPEYQGLTDDEKAAYVKKIFDFSKQIGKLEAGMPEEKADSYVLKAKEGQDTLGLDPSKYLAMAALKASIDKDETTDDKTMKAIDFKIAVNERNDLTDEQKAFIKNNIQFFNMFPVNTDSFDKAVNAGLTNEQAKTFLSVKSAMDTDGNGSLTDAERVHAIENSGEPEDVQEKMWEAAKRSDDKKSFAEAKAKAAANAQAEEAVRKQAEAKDAVLKQYFGPSDLEEAKEVVAFIENNGGYFTSMTQWGNSMKAAGVPRSKWPAYFNYTNAMRGDRAWGSSFEKAAKDHAW